MQRWYRGDEAAEQLRAVVETVGGHATLYRGASAIQRFHPLPGAAARLQERIRQAFDPHGVLNRRDGVSA